MNILNLRDPAFLATTAAGGGGGPPLPSLPGLLFHVKADSLALSDNDPVASWPDQGGEGNDVANATGSQRPLYKVNIQNSLPGVLFDGTDDYLSRTSAVNQPENSTVYSIYAVLRFTDADTTESVFGAGESVGFRFLKTGSNRAITHRSVADLVDGAATNNTELWSAVKTSAPLTKLWINGVNETITNSTAAMTAPGVSPIFVGRFSTGLGFFFTGYIFELLWYENDHSDTDRQAVEAYLNGKWGVF